MDILQKRNESRGKRRGKGGKKNEDGLSMCISSHDECNYYVLQAKINTKIKGIEEKEHSLRNLDYTHPPPCDYVES